MGWGEIQRIPNEYNDEFRSIDETILRLFKERKLLAKGKRYFPPKEIMQEWAINYEMDIPAISFLMHSFNEGIHPKIPNEPGELLSVMPIMKKTVVDGFEYHLTHAMQHMNGSIVFLEIEQLQSDDMHAHIRPQLLLEVKGNQEYYVRRTGSHGGGGQTQMRFMVMPPLPHNINEVGLGLVPYGIPMEIPPKDMILDKEVVFE
ncbi:hypothetical protein SAMN03159341_101785 [Paenibacillus sp. 1_12]|uniref:hypothetical protein n=1 Tax=Paenibacillus sp. 1_12 TaxID=1566278 RepID=UPI0008E8011B|nr:hypothetical protein [Paenibacillus sp. 1_12]SFK83110.1 hypothetical protein SAMN03159341_101785 [Paenibacillus sp. 1_12]